MKFEGVAKSLAKYNLKSDYEHEHRNAEHEHEKVPELCKFVFICGCLRRFRSEACTVTIIFP